MYVSVLQSHQDRKGLIKVDFYKYIILTSNPFSLSNHTTMQTNLDKCVFKLYPLQYFLKGTNFYDALKFSFSVNCPPCKDSARWLSVTAGHQEFVNSDQMVLHCIISHLSGSYLKMASTTLTSMSYNLCVFWYSFYKLVLDQWIKYRDLWNQLQIYQT